MLTDYEFRPVMEHIEVYKNGQFVLSADTHKEARDEINKLENPCLFKYNCSWYDSDLGCTCPSHETWYQCPMQPEPNWEEIYGEDKCNEPRSKTQDSE